MLFVVIIIRQKHDRLPATCGTLCSRRSENGCGDSSCLERGNLQWRRRCGSTRRRHCRGRHECCVWVKNVNLQDSCVDVNASLKLMSRLASLSLRCIVLHRISQSAIRCKRRQTYIRARYDCVFHIASCDRTSKGCQFFFHSVFHSRRRRHQRVRPNMLRGIAAPSQNH